jgi:hypothetical protein
VSIAGGGGGEGKRRKEKRKRNFALSIHAHAHTEDTISNLAQYIPTHIRYIGPLPSPLPDPRRYKSRRDHLLPPPVEGNGLVRSPLCHPGPVRLAQGSASL